VDLREICCEDGRWMELVQDLVLWWSSTLVVINPETTRLRCDYMDWNYGCRRNIHSLKDEKYKMYQK